MGFSAAGARPAMIRSWSGHAREGVRETDSLTPRLWFLESKQKKLPQTGPNASVVATFVMKESPKQTRCSVLGEDLLS